MEQILHKVYQARYGGELRNSPQAHYRRKAAYLGTGSIDQELLSRIGAKVGNSYKRLISMLLKSRLEIESSGRQF